MMNKIFFIIKLLIGLTLFYGINLHASPIRVLESQPSSTASTPKEAMLTASSGGSELVMLFERLQVMQQELLQLRGLLEEQEQALQRFSRENKDRYLDLDSRISALQKQNNDTSASLPPSNKNKQHKQIVNKTDLSEKQEELYQKALALVKTRRFSEATTSFNKYLSKHPTGEFAGNSYYWLGEVYLVQNEPEKAKAAFEKILSEFSNSSKASDATYKLGRVLGRLGDEKAEKKFMNRVISQYPQSAAAKLADTYLKNLVD